MPLRKIHFGTVLLLTAIAAGAFLRFSGIGTYGFWTDELFHVFAAESYLKDGTFDVPWSPHEYTRALPVTLLTALSFKLFGQNEATARVPFALTNVLFIAIAYAILKNLLSRNVALIFSLAISFSVFSIQISQECRMYTLFQLFYFLMSIAFLQGLEHDQFATPSMRAGFLRCLQSSRGISVKLLIAALGLGFFAIWLQELTFNFTFVVLAYCMTMSVYEDIVKDFGKLYKSKYIATITLLMIIALSFFIFLGYSNFEKKFIQPMLYQYYWYQLSQSNFSFYQRVLTDSHLTLWALYPLGAFLTIHRYGRQGLFFVLSFCVPFFMHCFIFGRQSERYIFYILPFFITVSAVAVDFLISSIIAFASIFASTLTSTQKKIFYIVVCASLSLLIYPSVKRTVLDSSVAKFSNWKDLDPAMVQAVTSGASITTDRLRFNYYFKQYPHFVIDASDVNRAGGKRVIINLADFKKALAQHPNLYLVTYAKHLYREVFVSPDVKDYILRELDRVDREDDQRIMVFRSQAKKED